MSQEKHSDEVAELLGSLRSLEPSLESRLENRRVIASELARLSQASSPASTAWWKRSVSIPVPVAIAASVVALCGATWLGLDSFKGLATSTEMTSQPSSQNLDVPKIVAPARESKPVARPSFEMTETYLCGVGRISTDTLYTLEED